MSVDEAKDFGITERIIATLPLYQQSTLGFQTPEVTGE
jgi:hypothetical protein